MRFADRPLIAGFIPRVYHFKVVCFHSVTVMWSYILALAGVALEALMMFPDVSNSLGLAQFIPPKYTPFYMFGIAAITLVARLRSILGHKEDRDNGMAAGSPADRP